jgi:mannosylglycerate hydrolase
MRWLLPEKKADDEKTRSEHKLPVDIESIVTLRKGSRYLEIETTINNRCEDHYLQVAFPTGIKATHADSQGQFDVVSRPIAAPDYSLYDEPPMTEHPMNSFVSITDGKNGVALLNTGLKAYEAADDEENTVFLSLLRAYPLRICVTKDMQNYNDWDKGSQCIGKNTFRYAFMPHKGNWEEGNVWQESERFNLYLAAGQIAPTAHGKNATTHSFIELKDENLNISAVKKSEDGEGYIIRLFNPSDKTVKNAIRLNGGIAPITEVQSPVERQKAEFELPQYSGKKWSQVKLVTLEELDEKELTLSNDGFVDFEITGKKILTLKFIG